MYNYLCKKSFIGDKNNQPLEKPRGHRLPILSKETKEKLKQLYKDLSYEHKGVLYAPSMQILKNMALEKIENFPNLHIEKNTS